MVLATLGQKIKAALSKIGSTNSIDENTINELLKEICNALIECDVNFRTVHELRNRITSCLNLDTIAIGTNKSRVIDKIVFEELIKMVDPGISPWKPQKGKTNIIMFVGLQGSGKTTSVVKMATFYKRKGFRTAVVCADTFRAGAFDQIWQNSCAASIPCYGNINERDPVKLAKDGIDNFIQAGYEIIIVDTSGRNKQDEELFEEMKQVSTVINPQQIVFVMDGSIGQVAFDHAKAFKEAVSVGAVIITKLDGGAKGGGAISAVAATKSPIIFIGTGESLQEFQEFEPRSFVSRLLGKGDIKGMLNVLKNSVPKPDGLTKKRIQRGNFSLRDLQGQFQSILKMGSISQIVEMLPQFPTTLQTNNNNTNINKNNSNNNGNTMCGRTSEAKLKSFVTILDSMNEKELDDHTLINKSCVNRIARGSGKSVHEVNELIMYFQQLKKIVARTIGLDPRANGNVRRILQMGGARELLSLNQ